MIYIPLSVAGGRILEPSDIAITLDGTVGLVRIGLKGAYSTGVRKVVIKDQSHLGWGFVFCFLRSDFAQATIHAHAKGTTIKHAGGAVEALEFVCPPRENMVRFEEVAEPLINKILNLEHSNDVIRRSRDLLLPRLLSGQLDVSAVEQEYEEIAV
jgi:type I restriction enzyme S subunit